MAGTGLLGARQTVMKEIGILVFVCGAGAAFGIGLAVACKLLKWAPVNVTVTINNPLGMSATVETTTSDMGRET